MNAKDILARRFEKATFNGYKTDDVDEFLREVSNEFSQLQKDKTELERKLEVLADKIREYRDDEEALKDALLLAQKQGNQIISNSKAAAAKLKQETDEAVAKQLAQAKEKSDEMIKSADEYAKRMTKESNDRANKLVKDARNKAEEIHDLMQRQTEIQQTVLQKTHKEVDEYRARLLAAYKTHLELVTKLPEMCENEFIRATAEEVEKREAERAKTAIQKPAQRSVQGTGKNNFQQPKPSKQPEAPKPAPVQDVKAKPEPSENAEPFKSVPINEKDTAKTGEFEMPFFNPSNEKKTRRSDLQFGKNNNNK